jgi:hypothetical protein
MINAFDGSSFVLNSVDTFGSTSVILLGGINTNYTCSYIGGYRSILNITGSKLFTMENGILKFGNILNSTSYYFMCVSGIRKPLLNISNIKIQFVSKTNSLIYIEGGKVILKSVKVNSQSNAMWVNPLVDVFNKIDSVTVELFSCEISNCTYESSSLYKSGVVYFNDNYNTIKPITFNMSLCLFLNNTFNISNNVGGVCAFFSGNLFSG